MASLRYEGVLFKVFPEDHEPPHVHALIAEASVILELRPGRTVALAKRKDAILPPNAKKSDVKRALDVAAKYFDELVELWEKMHG